jgi:hypothetical protein
MAQTAKDMNSNYKETSEAATCALRDSLLIEGFTLMPEKDLALQSPSTQL